MSSIFYKADGLEPLLPLLLTDNGLATHP